MRHRVYGKHLSRDKNQRTALFRSLVRELILHESIQTTAVKAKSIKGLVDKLINKSKQNTNASKQVVQSFVNQPVVSKKLLEEIAPRYTDRTSGFTQVVRLGSRPGDGAVMVQMSLINADAVRSGKSEDQKIGKSEKKEVTEAKVNESTESEESKVEEKPKRSRKEKKV